MQNKIVDKLIGYIVAPVVIAIVYGMAAYAMSVVFNGTFRINEYARGCVIGTMFWAFLNAIVVKYNDGGIK